MIPMKEVEKELTGKPQCKSVKVSGAGRSVRMIFCRRPDGHDGDHRGFRVQWAQEVKP